MGLAHTPESVFQPTTSILKRGIAHWLLLGALLGLIILGIGGRLLMRLIAHMEHRTQFVLTVGGTLTVIFAGTAAGLVAALIYVVVRRIIRPRVVRTLVFAVVVELIVWRGVSGLLPIPQLMFLALGAVFIAAVLFLDRHAQRVA
jgi:hypothetical protein